MGHIRGIKYSRIEILRFMGAGETLSTKRHVVKKWMWSYYEVIRKIYLGSKCSYKNFENVDVEGGSRRILLCQDRGYWQGVYGWE